MKKLTTLLFAITLLLCTNVGTAKAEGEEVTTGEKEKAKVYFFYGDGCGYCAAAKEFFASIEEEYGYMYDLQLMEVWNDKDNANLMEQVADTLGEEASGVPYIIIGDYTVNGYDESYNEDILAAIEKEYNAETKTDVMTKLTTTTNTGKSSDTIVILSLGIIIIGVVGLLVFAKTKAN